MSNKHFSILIALIVFPFFGWMVMDYRASSRSLDNPKGVRDVLVGSDGSMAQVQYLFHFAEPSYNHSLNTSQIETLSQSGAEGEHYHVYGLTQAEYGTDTHYEVNWSKRWFKEEYDLWMENLQVDFSYNTVNVYVTQQYPEGSCEYRETLAHENLHVDTHKKVYFRFQEIIKETLGNSKTIPLSSHPLRVSTIEEGKKEVGERIAGIMDPLFGQFRDALAVEQARIDTPENYERLKQACSQW